MKNYSRFAALLGAAVLACAPLILVGVAHSQPVVSDFPTLSAYTPASASTGYATPLCLGPSMVRNTPSFFQGANGKVGTVQMAWCQMTNGEWAGWFRVRAPGAETTGAPLVWMTDLTTRTATGRWAVWPSTLADKSRTAYSPVSTQAKGFTLGPANGKRAQADQACACDMMDVVSGGYHYCPYAPTPDIGSVAACRLVPAATKSVAAAKVAPLKDAPAVTASKATVAPSAEQMAAMGHGSDTNIKSETALALRRDPMMSPDIPPLKFSAPASAPVKAR